MMIPLSNFLAVAAIGLIAALLSVYNAICLRDERRDNSYLRNELKRKEDCLAASQMCQSGMARQHEMAMRFMANFAKHAVYDNTRRLYTVLERDLNAAISKES